MDVEIGVKISQLTKAGMPKEVIVMYCANELYPVGDIEARLRHAESTVAFEKAIPTMLTYYIRENEYIPGINLSYLRVCLRKLLKIKEIEIALKYASYALERLPLLRYSEDIDQGYKDLIDEINKQKDGEEPAKKENAFDLFQMGLRDGILDLDLIPTKSWPENFIKGLIGKTDELLPHMLPCLTRAYENKIYYALFRIYSGYEIHILCKYFGINKEEKMTLQQISNEFDWPLSVTERRLESIMEELRKKDSIKNFFL